MLLVMMPLLERENLLSQYEVNIVLKVNFLQYSLRCIPTYECELMFKLFAVVSLLLHSET